MLSTWTGFRSNYLNTRYIVHAIWKGTDDIMNEKKNCITLQNCTEAFLVLKTVNSDFWGIYWKDKEIEVNSTEN